MFYKHYITEYHRKGYGNSANKIPLCLSCNEIEENNIKSINIELFNSSHVITYFYENDEIYKKHDYNETFINHDKYTKMMYFN